MGWEVFNLAQIETVKSLFRSSENWPVILSEAASSSTALFAFPFLSEVDTAPLSVYPDSPDEKLKYETWPLVGIFLLIWDPWNDGRNDWLKLWNEININNKNKHTLLNINNITSFY